MLVFDSWCGALRLRLGMQGGRPFSRRAAAGVVEIVMRGGRGVMMAGMMEAEMRREGEARKARSMARLRREGVAVMEHLPWIECDPGTINGVEEVARRVMVLTLLAVYAEHDGMPRGTAEEFIDARGVRRDLTGREAAFLAKVNPTMEERGPFTWQYESVHALLWAMGYVKDFGGPTTFCKAAGVSSIVAPRSLEALIGEARMRPAGEIFDRCDLAFRYHWAARDATLRGQEPAGGLIAPVCFYRHLAFSWLVGGGTNWDDVDPST